MPSTRLARPAALAAAILLATTGCGGGDTGDPEPSTGPSSSSAQPGGPTSTPSGPGDGSRGIPTEAEVEVVEVRGDCVYAAVGDSERWALRGAVEGLETGQRLALTGAPDDTAYPECPDGRPFLVSSVEPVG
ncbi:hypothetical protein [Phycicoccus sonneratiae]|uniref:Secreted protein n=1 Tax=Phycicoccus sonneratiae TaxID=2807628 RepID=A0ABS2CP34_9MICO|nr:hypothetical protein [Phycicoccus sonneraticus]MBM6401642.1 hypothetical protein [Phycicoccus sonneraticus]